jgi:phage recombination protein Bet
MANTDTALVPSQNGAVASAPAAGQWDNRQIEIIKRTIAPGISDDELYLFSLVCQRTGLDPFFKQIYAIKRGGKMTIQTGIDGYRLLAERTGCYAGSDDPEYNSEEAEHPGWAKVTVWKIVQGHRYPFSAKARWSEYASPTNDLWKKMPYLMLAKCAESLALRKAFPAELSGIYTREEMHQAENDLPTWATPAQKKAMKTACQLLSFECPTEDEMNAMTFDDMEVILAQYRREYQQRQESEASHD